MLTENVKKQAYFLQILNFLGCRKPQFFTMEYMHSLQGWKCCAERPSLIHVHILIILLVYKFLAN